MIVYFPPLRSVARTRYRPITRSCVRAGYYRTARVFSHSKHRAASGSFYIQSKINLNFNNYVDIK